MMNATAAFQQLAPRHQPMMIVIVKTIGERLAHALKVRNKSGRWLTDKAGFSQGHVSRLINGRGEGADAETLARCSDALEISFEWLATGRGDINPRARVVELDTPARKPIRFGDLPGWHDAELEARARFDDIPDYAFDRAADTSGGRAPSKIDEHTVANFARAWLASTTREERKAAEAEKVRADMAAEERKAEERKNAPPSSKSPKSRLLEPTGQSRLRWGYCGHCRPTARDLPAPATAG
jgi:transcriptional regulator with XRE-family HTH domain